MLRPSDDSVLERFDQPCVIGAVAGHLDHEVEIFIRFSLRLSERLGINHIELNLEYTLIDKRSDELNETLLPVSHPEKRRIEAEVKCYPGRQLSIVNLAHAAQDCCRAVHIVTGAR